jgi:hypothetical protein
MTQERPIIFTAESVRAILEGRKTQTRRVMKPQPSEGWTPDLNGFVHKMGDGGFVLKNGDPIVIGWGPSNAEGDEAYPCPHGQPGDRLWVRETWTATREAVQKKDAASVLYRALPMYDDCGPGDFGFDWKSPILMPRWASRITLEVVSIRVERVQSISKEDAIAEGVKWNRTPCRVGDTNPISAYHTEWNRINGKKASWDSNPWVWVIEFRVVEIRDQNNQQDQP